MFCLVACFVVVCPLALCGWGCPPLLAPPAVLLPPGGRAVGRSHCRHLLVQRFRLPPLGPRSSLNLRLGGGPGSLVVASPRYRCPCLRSTIFALYFNMRWACSRRRGLVGTSSLALFSFSWLFASLSVHFNPYSGKANLDTSWGPFLRRALGLFFACSDLTSCIPPGNFGLLPEKGSL